MKTLIILLLPISCFCQLPSGKYLKVKDDGTGFELFTLNAVTSTKLADSTAVLRTVINSGLSTKQNTLGFTPYNATNPNGYISVVPAQTFASITGKPTTLSGYGITDAYPLTGNPSSFTGQVAAINLTAQVANIATTTLYAVPSTGFYRVSIYISVTQAATTSSTMPSTTIAYTDGVNSTSHSTATTATNTGNSLSTSFAQATYVCYAKTGTNITFATASFASSGATGMQYQLRIRCEAL